MQICSDPAYVDPSLTIQGIEYISSHRHKLLSHLKLFPPTLVFISPLKRTLQTFCFTFAHSHKQSVLSVPVYVSHLVRETQEEPAELKTSDWRVSFNSCNPQTAQDLMLQSDPNFARIQWESSFLCKQVEEAEWSSTKQISTFHRVLTSLRRRRSGKGKDIEHVLVFAHHNVIQQLTKQDVGFYEWVTCRYKPKKKLFVTV